MFIRKDVLSAVVKGVLTVLTVSFASGCMVQKESTELILKGSVAESAEIVTLDPMFLSRQKRAESQFFGFDSSTKTEAGNIPLSFDEDDGDVAVESSQEGSEGGKGFGNIALSWPVKGAISSPFGMRRGRLHAGLDIGAARGTPIYAAADGQVLTAKYRGAYGQAVIVGHDNDHQTLYAHMLRMVAKEGQYVKAGDLLGLVGRTGRATGYHLHFETRVAGGIPQNPMRFLPNSKTRISQRLPASGSMVGQR